METEWEKLENMKFEDVCPGENIDEVSMIKFWGDVWDLKTADGRRVCGEIARFVLSVLTFPTSNAVVERLFSVLALVKSKIRNRMGLQMLDAILRVRTHLHVSTFA